MCQITLNVLEHIETLVFSTMPTEIIALMIVVTLLLEDQIVKKNRGNRMGLCLCAITDILFQLVSSNT